MPIQGVIFDHDGTLVDSERCHYQIWQDLLKTYGVTLLEDEYIQNSSGVPTLANARYLVEKYTLSCGVEKLLAEKEHKTEQYFCNQAMPLMKNAEKCINQCHDLGLTLAIATGASRGMVQKGIGQSPCFARFKAVSTSDCVANNKPAPDVYQHAQTSMGIDTEKLIAVEDSPTGIAAAKSANLRCIAVTNAYSQKQDLSQADYLVNNLDEAYQIIEGLTNP